jgi:Amt family ammonium transporter
VTTEGELQGLDLHEHGIPAYPEYALYPSAAPRGMPGFAESAFSNPQPVGSKIAPSH